MRQLAAILFVDMVGYTSTMQADERLARAKRSRMKETLETTIPEYEGKIFQNYGDGALCIFNSAISAVRFAIRLQQRLRQQPIVDVRIGIHTGDVEVNDDGIYGNSVNMASRIESLAVPGSIFISEKVSDEIKNQNDISSREIGYFELKNISEPIRIFAVGNPGIVVPQRANVSGKLTRPTDRLAVLPFVNLTADPNNEFLADGITEEIGNAISHLEGLQVVSRTSSFSFKGKNNDIREIGKQLNVDKILEGTVRKQGNRVRITAHLIDATNGYRIWSENYDGTLSDIFELQDQFSQIIADKLKKNSTIFRKKGTLRIAA